MNFPVLVALALAPIFAIGLYIYLKDKYEKEPLSRLVLAFILGVISTLPAMALEMFGENVLGFGPSSNILTTAIFAFIVVGFSEEISKFAFFRLKLYKDHNLNEPLDGIVYMTMVGLGFAALENVFYTFSTDSFEKNAAIALTRAFTAVPAHATFGILMGYYIGLAKFAEKPVPMLARGIFIAVLLHGTYDYFLFQENYEGLVFISFVSLVIAIRYSIQAIKIHQEASPFKNE